MKKKPEQAGWGQCGGSMIPPSSKDSSFLLYQAQVSSTIIQVFKAGSKTQGIRKELLLAESTPFKEHS